MRVIGDRCTEILRDTENASRKAPHCKTRMRTDKNLPHAATGPLRRKTQAGNTQKYQSVLLVGPPGVGKGTQGELLSGIPGIYHLSSGDMFRQLEPHSDLGKIFHEYATRGDLVPDDITVKIWRHYMQTQISKQEYNPNCNLLILDGIPRNIKQAALIAPYINVLKIIYMICENQQVMFSRIRGRAAKEHRLDDAQESIVRHRWTVYKRETEPLIDYYSQELIRIVDADTIPAEVLLQILSAVIPVQKEHLSPPFL